MVTVQTLLQHTQQQLTPVAQENAALEARMLVQEVTGLTREALLRDGAMPVHPDQHSALELLVQRRLRREPMAQILGYKDFWRDRFVVSSDVLTPRADSETMIEALVRAYPERSQELEILELGVGSGCLILSALREYPQARVVGVDRSAAALAVAQANAERLQLAPHITFLQGDWCKPLDRAQKFDIVLTNPPYIPHAEIAALMPEVQGFEPHSALDGGEDGLACYRSILAEIPPFLKSGSRIFVEVGVGQAESIVTIAAAQGMRKVALHQDLGGIARIVELQYD